jgi:hypothetical protein
MGFRTTLLLGGLAAGLGYAFSQSKKEHIAVKPESEI